jgi:hypothetical protein
MAGKAVSLRDFVAGLDTALNATDPAVLEADGAVVSIAPGPGGLVGLDLDTGKPVRLEPRYKSVAEKPVIINAGSKQIVIPPPPLPPPAAPLPPVLAAGAPPTTWAKASALGDFLLDEGFADRWREVLAAKAEAEGRATEDPSAPRDWPPSNRVRQRVVDT